MPNLRTMGIWIDLLSFEAIKPTLWIASYDQALQHKPDDPTAWYNKACAYALQQQPDPAIETLSKAIALDSQKYRAMARTNTNFDSICTDPRFLTLLGEP